MATERRTGVVPLAEGTLRQAAPTGLDAARAQEMAAVFKALGDPTPLQIMSLLSSARAQGLCVCDIGANFPLGQPTISHHLKLLKDAGLVASRKRGLWVYYSAEVEYLCELGIRLPVSAFPVQASECVEAGPDGAPANFSGGPDP